MLKRNWNWKKIKLFCHILSLVNFQLGRGRTPCPPPLGYAYVPSEENKKGVRKFSARFLAFSNKISTVQKIVLSSSRGQANFRGLEASRPRPRPRTWPSRPRPRPRTSKCVLEDVLEAKDVLEDSTSASNNVRFDCAFSATVCMNAAIKLWQLELLKWKCWYIQYSKHTGNVHSLIHDWDIFLFVKIELRPIIKGWVNWLV